MTKVSMSLDLEVPAAAVWKTIGGFDAVPDWHPGVTKSRVDGPGEGSIRTLELAMGGTIEERLDHVDAAARTYSYSIVRGPLPMAGYLATLTTRERDGGGCTIQWESSFEPAGVGESEAVKIVEAIYQARVENLKRMFGAGSTEPRRRGGRRGRRWPPAGRCGWPTASRGAGGPTSWRSST